jgi:hypothetical protein
LRYFRRLYAIIIDFSEEQDRIYNRVHENGIYKSPKLSKPDFKTYQDYSTGKKAKARIREKFPIKSEL